MLMFDMTEKEHVGIVTANIHIPKYVIFAPAPPQTFSNCSATILHVKLKTVDLKQEECDPSRMPQSCLQN